MLFDPHNHKLLIQRVQAAPRDDPLRVILTELDGVPNLGSEELKDARDRAVTLELTNRFADVRGAPFISKLVLSIY